VKQTIKEAALDYLAQHDGNLYAADRNVTLCMLALEVDVESVWHSKQDDKVYLHVGCKEFEGDIDIESLSDDNQQRMRKALSMKKDRKERLLQETIVMLAADLYQTLYDRENGDGWGDVCSTIIYLAKRFERELDWQEYDERDYIDELQKFEDKVLKERGLKS
jgi:hypothetical protein